MHIEWHQRKMGKGTDSDNIVARCAAYRDGVAQAGLVADDNAIAVGEVVQHWLPRRATAYDEYVVLRLERTG